MIYFLYGNNVNQARVQANKLVDSLRTKKPDASFVKMDDESFERGTLEELAFGGQGLFESRALIFLDNIFFNNEAKEFVLDNLETLGSSENVFIFLEGKIDKKTIKKIDKYASKVSEFSSEEKGGAKPAFNIFSITDTFGARDRKSTWVLFHKALMSGVSPEEIHGIIFWQIKNMLIAQNSTLNESGKAGIKPFVFNKSLRTSRNFKEGELKRLSSDMISMYHGVRMGEGDLGTELEKFILNL